ncbi:lactonase family protein [Sinomicrobium pectinilyticum]|uniref:Lactonase family protein n=1 Tax=Sinomicrobium pectinilyticum TaxID=1084421 RepID=A0A3N0E5H6_SINP1|nr:lactonase family protein [Sinomicrobium pectinilyticum]RNL83104.1 lactonase family protein [Sinomicrobium pectinilyticum]
MLKKTLIFLICTMSLLACKDKKKESGISADKTEQSPETGEPKEASYAFVGTYTRKEGHVDGQAKGVYLLQRDDENGKLERESVAAEVVNPSYLAISPDKKNLYAVSEVASEGETGALYVYGLDEFQNPVFLQKLSTDAKAPCYVNLDSEGKYVFVVNYVGGVVKMYTRGEKGILSSADTVQLHGSGPDKDRQSESHPHSVVISPDNRFVFVPDLGSDKIWSFEIDREENKLLPLSNGFVSAAPGAGPRHLVFHPNGKYVYLINELNNTVNAFSFEAEKGLLSEIQTISTLPKGFNESSSAADIHVHPNGKFLYGSNRGHNSIVVYAIDQENGKLSPVQHQPVKGKTPRNFAIHPSGKQLYAANQDSGNIVQFAIDQETGKLSFETELDVNSPVCIKFYP